MTKLSADTLKDTLWDTLQALKKGSMPPQQGHAISSQAREILRTVNAQIKIHNSYTLPNNLHEFANKKAGK